MRCQCNSCKSIDWFCSLYWTLNESESDLWMYIGRFAPNLKNLKKWPCCWISISPWWTLELLTELIRNYLNRKRRQKKGWSFGSARPCLPLWFGLAGFLLRAIGQALQCGVCFSWTADIVFPTFAFWSTATLLLILYLTWYLEPTSFEGISIFQTAHLSWVSMDESNFFRKRESVHRSYGELRPSHPTFPPTLKDFQVRMRRSTW